MAESWSTRLGLRRWSANPDTFDRTELDTSFSSLEQKVAGALSGTIGARPAVSSAVDRFLYYATDTKRLYFCADGAWNEIALSAIKDAWSTSLVPTLGVSSGSITLAGTTLTSKIKRIGSVAHVVVTCNITMGMTMSDNSAWLYISLPGLSVPVTSEVYGVCTYTGEDLSGYPAEKYGNFQMNGSGQFFFVDGDGRSLNRANPQFDNTAGRFIKFSATFEITPT